MLEHNDGRVEVEALFGAIYPVPGIYRRRTVALVIDNDQNPSRAIVPAGTDAAIKIDGITYLIRNYRGRPGHTPGALIKSNDIVIKLAPATKLNFINGNRFQYHPTPEAAAAVLPQWHPRRFLQVIVKNYE